MGTLARTLIADYRVFENEGILVGDYRKSEGLLADPDKNITLWVLPEPISCLLCRIIIYGKPIEVRLAEKLVSSEAAYIHRTMLGACNGKALKSTTLGDLTNSLLANQGCPGLIFVELLQDAKVTIVRCA